ncbi:hypothetical protein LCGC14_2883070, partial [marine sediment metagenome]
MADPRFYRVAGPFRLAELAEIAGAKLAAGGDPDSRFDDVASLGSAQSGHVGFLENTKYLSALETSRAGACILHPDMADRAPDGMALLLSKAPYKGFALIGQAFHPGPAFEPGVASSAWVDESASLGEGSRVEHGAVVGNGVEIGSRCLIGANAVIGDAVRIGDDSVIGANTTLSHCLIGSRVIVYPGVCIGQSGFGFALDPAGHVKIPQLGRVIVEDDVEIGANTTVDRGAGPDTVIGAGTKIDNLVQIAHNVRIGRGSVLAGHTGISGSTELGDMVVMAGQSGVAGHLKIGSGAQIGA